MDVGVGMGVGAMEGGVGMGADVMTGGVSDVVAEMTVLDAEKFCIELEKMEAARSARFFSPTTSSLTAAPMPSSEALAPLIPFYEDIHLDIPKSTPLKAGISNHSFAQALLLPVEHSSKEQVTYAQAVDETALEQLGSWLKEDAWSTGVGFSETETAFSECAFSDTGFQNEHVPFSDISTESEPEEMLQIEEWIKTQVPWSLELHTYTNTETLFQQVQQWLTSAPNEPMLTYLVSHIFQKMVRFLCAFMSNRLRSLFHRP